MNAYGYQRDIAPIEKWLPTRVCDLREIATCERLLPARYARLQDITYNYISISSDLTYSAILPDSEIYRDITASGIIARYWYLWDICACNISTITGCLFLVISPIRRFWLSQLSSLVDRRSTRLLNRCGDRGYWRPSISPWGYPRHCWGLI